VTGNWRKFGEGKLHDALLIYSVYIGAYIKGGKAAGA
jgi:hypothetical protein